MGHGVVEEGEDLQSDGTGSEGNWQLSECCQAAQPLELQVSRPTAGHAVMHAPAFRMTIPCHPDIRYYIDNNDNMLITIVTLVIEVVVILMHE